MKINKFLVVGAAVAILSLSAHAQEAPVNTEENNQQSSQQINPTVAKTLGAFGGFLGALANNAKNALTTATDGIKTIANSEGAQNIKKGVSKGTQFVSEKATEVAHSDLGQSITDTTITSAKFVATTANNGIKTIANSEGAQNIKKGVSKGTQFVSEKATEVAHSNLGQSVTDTTITSAKFVATTATDGVKAVSQGFKDTNANVLNDSNKFEPTVEAASINSVSQPTSLPSVEQGFESAKNKIGSIINLLRDKAISKDNTQDNKKESPSAQIK